MYADCWAKGVLRSIMTNSLSGSEVPNTELERRNSGLSSPSISDKHLRALHNKYFDHLLSFDVYT